MSRSFIRSGAYLCCGVCSSSKSQPMWACHRPFQSAPTVSPYFQGECGSPSLSENLWCLRWSATHRTTGPWIAIEPRTARAILIGRLGLKDRWVKPRWKPTVTPPQVRKYIGTAIATSVQPSQPPQATGTAASSAANGTRMNRASATCSLRDWVSPPSVARGRGRGGLGVLQGGGHGSPRRRYLRYRNQKWPTSKPAGARRRPDRPAGAGSLPAMPAVLDLWQKTSRLPQGKRIFSIAFSPEGAVLRDDPAALRRHPAQPRGAGDPEAPGRPQPHRDRARDRAVQRTRGRDGGAGRGDDPARQAVDPQGDGGRLHREGRLRRHLHRRDRPRAVDRRRLPTRGATCRSGSAACAGTARS